MNKTLFILIGLKGSGKTYIGTLIGSKTDITFLRVEPVWLSLSEGEDGWLKVEETIAELFRHHDKVMIESLGAGEGFTGMYNSLKSKHETRMIKVETDPKICLQRVQTRDNKDHIPVSDNKVEEYNRIAAQVEYDWDLVIDNNGPASEDEILRAFRTLK